MRMAQKIGASKKFDENETISEALIDLYLSVKIRTNEEVSYLIIHQLTAPDLGREHF